MRPPTPGLDGPREGAGDWGARLKGSSFSPAALLLDARARTDLATLYAYCRAIDDCSDEFGPREAAAHLERWRRELGLLRRGRPASALGRSLGELCARRGVPPALLEDLWLGARSDARGSVRLRTWKAVRLYCYRVAGSVGLACLPLFGLDPGQGRPYALALGEAFQLINILRDVREDAGRGRLYFALEDLDACGLSPRAFMEGRGGAGADRLLRLYADRARQALARSDAAAAAAALPRRGLRAPRLMRALYGGILDAMERGSFGVFHTRYRLASWRKCLAVGRALVAP